MVEKRNLQGPTTDVNEKQLRALPQPSTAACAPEASCARDDLISTETRLTSLRRIMTKSLIATTLPTEKHARMLPSGTLFHITMLKAVRAKSRQITYSRRTDLLGDKPSSMRL